MTDDKKQEERIAVTAGWCVLENCHFFHHTDAEYDELKAKLDEMCKQRDDADKLALHLQERWRGWRDEKDMANDKLRAELARLKETQK